LGVLVGSDVKELLSTLKEVEKRLIAVHDVRIGIVYLAWGVALVGFMFLFSFTYLLLPDGAMRATALCYWIGVTLLVIYLITEVEYSVRTFISKFEQPNPKAHKVMTSVSIAGWCVAVAIGWFLIPMMLGEVFIQAGLLIFLAIGNFSIYLSIRLAYKTVYNSVAIASAVLVALSLPASAISAVDPGASWMFASAAAALVYLSVAFYHFRSSIKILY